MGQLPDFTGALIGIGIVLCVVSAVVGWAAIEGVLWIASHVDVVWE